MAAKTIERPLDIIRLCLDERVVVRLKGSRELKGKLFVSTLDFGPPFEPGAPMLHARGETIVAWAPTKDGFLCPPCLLLLHAGITCDLLDVPYPSYKVLQLKTLLTPAPYTPPSNTKLQAFDEHVNMVLGDCEETHTSEETDGETGEVSLKSTTRQLGLIFVRGDIVIFVSPR